MPVTFGTTSAGPTRTLRAAAPHSRYCGVGYRGTHPVSNLAGSQALVRQLGQRHIGDRHYQHRHAQDYVYKVGEREMICWHAESGILLEDTRKPADLDAA